MRRSLAVLAPIVGALCAIGAPAAANPSLQRIVIDRVDLEPSPIWGYARLRAFVSALDLGASGKVMPITGDGAWKLKVGGGEKSIPYLAGTYANADSNLAVVLVVETAFEYSNEASPGAGSDLHVIQAALDDLLTKLPPRTQVAVIGYGNELSFSKLGPVKTAQARLAKLTPDEESGSPQLLAALAKAVGALKNVQTDPENQPVRKLIILVSDGRDKTDNPQDITKAAVAAARAGIEIDCVAYQGLSPSKGPLVNLGELAKKSHGALRWAEQISSMPARVQNVASELNDEYVITWLVEPDEIAGKKLAVTGQVGGATIESFNDVKIPGEPTCSGATCPNDGYCASYKCVAHGKPKGRGAFGWILIVGGIALGGVLVLFVVGLAITKLRRKPMPMPTFAPGVPGVPFAPGGPGAPAPAPFAPPVAAAPAAPAPPAPVVGPQLYMMNGPRSGQRVGVRHGFLIGKQPGCDLVLEDDGFASSQHAQILMDTGGNCTLVDKGSTNGTFVNGVRVTQYALTHGVAIRVGSTELRFLAQ